MQYLPLLILLLFVSILSILIDRRRMRKLAAAQSAVPTGDNPAAAATPALPGMLARLTQQWSQRFGRKPSVPDDPVREWLAAVFVENPAERIWFASLTPEQFKVLRSELTAFCAELGFDLNWLIEQTPFKPAVLEQTGKAIVTHYCRAVRAAVLVHNEMRAVQRYQDFLANPISKENLVFGQQMYARLVDEELAPAATPELMMAGEKERQSFVVHAIQSAAAQDAEGFGTILNAVVLGTLQPTPVVKEPVAPVMRNGASAVSASA